MKANVVGVFIAGLLMWGPAVAAPPMVTDRINPLRSGTWTAEQAIAAYKRRTPSFFGRPVPASSYTVSAKAPFIKDMLAVNAFDVNLISTQMAYDIGPSGDYSQISWKARNGYLEIVIQPHTNTMIVDCDMGTSSKVLNYTITAPGVIPGPDNAVAANQEKPATYEHYVFLAPSTTAVTQLHMSPAPTTSGAGEYGWHFQSCTFSKVQT